MYVGVPATVMATSDALREREGKVIWDEAGQCEGHVTDSVNCQEK